LREQWGEVARFFLGRRDQSGHDEVTRWMVDVVGEAAQRGRQRLELEPAGESRHARRDRCRGDGAGRADGLLETMGRGHGVAKLLGPRRDRLDASDLVASARAGTDEAGHGRHRRPDEQPAHQPVREGERDDAGRDGRRGEKEQPVEVGSPPSLAVSADEHCPPADAEHDEHDAQPDAGAQRHGDERVHCSHHPSGASSNDVSNPFASSNATVASRSG
jgi:hypothetical protein